MHSVLVMHTNVEVFIYLSISLLDAYTYIPGQTSYLANLPNSSNDKLVDKTTHPSSLPNPSSKQPRCPEGFTPSTHARVNE